MLGALTRGLWLTALPGGSEPKFALTGAAALLAVTQRTPIIAVVLAEEAPAPGPP